MQQHAVTPAGRILLDGEAIGRTLSRIAHEIIERNDDLAAVALVGIHTRGVPLAQRLRRLVAERAGTELELGQLDITFHRDDVHVRGGQAPRRLLPPRPPARRHLLSVGDLDRHDVDRLLATARSFALSQERESKKLPTLRGRLVVNLFYEASTRTSSSFELAAKRLSADTLSVKA